MFFANKTNKTIRFHFINKSHKKGLIRGGPRGLVIRETGPKSLVISETGPKSLVIGETGPKILVLVISEMPLNHNFSDNDK